MSAALARNAQPANDEDARKGISPLSKELVIGLVGYAGAGCSTAAKRLALVLERNNYIIHSVKLSRLIRERYSDDEVPEPVEGRQKGRSLLQRAVALQNLGDQLREDHKGFAVASLAVREIRRLRGKDAAGNQKIAFVIESIKHDEEVRLLREVYGESFRLLAVHCERKTRELRLIGDELSSAKYMGAPDTDVKKFMDRDENDSKNANGQHVRDAFYLADYFIDNNKASQNGENITEDVTRFVRLLLGSGLVRPTIAERAIYHAHAAALQSACLSRQVGAVLVSSAGEVVATGTNEAPRFGGGVYSEGIEPDHRCHAWTWDPKGEKFIGCHNDRKKKQLRHTVAEWLAVTLSEPLALIAHPVQPSGHDVADRSRKVAATHIESYLRSRADMFADIPGLKDLIEYSRAIHAEMDAVLSAGRAGIPTQGATLYCTTYPCHSCARHLVAAGIERVFYIEPYVKSLATELHEDSIANELPTKPSTGELGKMVVLPFTGVGPRMYEDFFASRAKLKDKSGAYLPPDATVPSVAVRLRELGDVEKSAADLVL